MIIPERLIKKHQAVEDAIDIWIARHVQVGTIIRWAKGKYQGRRARVTSVYWKDSWPNPYHITVGVEPERHDRKGWMESDRYFHKLAENFEVCDG